MTTTKQRIASATLLTANKLMFGMEKTTNSYMIYIKEEKPFIAIHRLCNATNRF